MYSVGSKVVHPFYGAGTIVKIQNKSIADSVHPYYIINTVARSMQVMVPVHRADEINLRPVAPKDELLEKLEIWATAPADHEISKDLRARQASMRNQLKSGSFYEIAGVARILYYMSNRRPLGIVDRQLLEQGKDFLAGELALASELEIDAAKQEIDNRLMSMLAEEEA